jgi:hypothetical protein
MLKCAQACPVWPCGDKHVSLKCGANTLLVKCIDAWGNNKKWAALPKNDDVGTAACYQHCCPGSDYIRKKAWSCSTGLKGTESGAGKHFESCAKRLCSFDWFRNCTKVLFIILLVLKLDEIFVCNSIGRETPYNVLCASIQSASIQRECTSCQEPELEQGCTMT